MTQPYGQVQASTRQQPTRRSFSNSIRSASSRLSFSGKRTNSAARSVSSLSDRQDHGEVCDTTDLEDKFGAYSLHNVSDLRRSSVVDMINQSNSSTVLISPAMSLHRADTDEADGSVTSNGTRSMSALGMRNDSSSSLNLAGSKWYRRFSKSGSGTRLSKALETADAAVVTTSGKSYNPFSRRRSVPAEARPVKSILGQSAQSAIEVGGHSSNASRLLPSKYLPESSTVEVPYIVDACISWLYENHAHMTPGIFRINGSSQAVKTVVEHFSGGAVRMPLENIALPGQQILSVHDIASCLKKYLVMLPGGLFGDAVFELLLAIAEEQAEQSFDTIPLELSDALLLITDQAKFHVILILMAFLRCTADQSKGLSVNDDPKQETGYMTSFSLSIVFSPACLGVREDSFEMRRSSTSHSDRSAQSDSTPIEEAVALARQGARVIKLLIDSWPEIVGHLQNAEGHQALPDVAFQIGTSTGRVEDEATKRYVQDFSKPLQTILDSPIKDAGSYHNAHSRTDSIDTVTMKRRPCDCDNSLLVKDAKIDLLLARVKHLELEVVDAMSSLRLKSDEAANLFTRNLELERENAQLRSKLAGQQDQQPPSIIDASPAVEALGFTVERKASISF